MQKKYAVFIEFEPKRTVSAEADGDFIVSLKHALLLSMNENRLLTDVQYQIAVELLNRKERKQSRERGQ